MNCAASLEQDGVFGERAKKQWKQASKDWEDFGRFAIPTMESWMVRLGELDQLKKERKKALDQLNALAPGVSEKLYERKKANLTDKQREALAAPQEQPMLAAQARAFLEVKPYEIARNPDVPRENRPKARELEEKIGQLDEQIKRTISYRGVVNYDYWDERAKIEQQDDMITARKLVYEGGQALAKGKLSAAARDFADASRAWYDQLRKHPMLMADKATVDDLEDFIKRYGKTLDQRDELFPPNFALAEFIRAQVGDNPKIHRIRLNRKKAEEAEAAGELATASTFYEKELQDWKLLIADLPSLEQMSDPVTGQLILATIRKYAEILKKLNQAIPDDFLLHRFVRVQMEHDPDAERAQAAIEVARSAKAAAQAAADQGHGAAEKENLVAARKAYEGAFTLWRGVLDRYPTLVADSTLGEELLVMINEYRQLLEQQKVQMPKDFILQDVLDRYNQP
jgi:hypothetical protein